VATAVVVVAAAGSGAWALLPASAPAATPPTVDVATATVVRTDLATTTQLSGTLGFGDATPVVAGSGGVLTGIAAPGLVIARGQTLFELDGAPVALLYGSRPPWRTLAVGVTAGPDVRQLEENLDALGYASLTPDDSFTAATAAAVRRWQRATGRPVTGRVDLGAVVYAPGAVRVESVAETPGAAVGPGQPVVQVTGTAPVVSVAVPAAQTTLVHVGDAVAVTLPSGTTTSARVTTVAAVATGGAQSDPGSGRPPEATVAAQVTLDDPAASGGLDQAPVTIAVTDRTANGVLAVPVTALVALAGGGYGVWVVQPGPRHLVGVTPGLFATTLVQVTGSGLAAGDVVEVPAP
jgi:peptidoglycan hydrolase-like protein with peptidoglycan-binding domain